MVRKTCLLKIYPLFSTAYKHFSLCKDIDQILIFIHSLEIVNIISKVVLVVYKLKVEVVQVL